MLSGIKTIISIKLTYTLETILCPKTSSSSTITRAVESTALLREKTCAILSFSERKGRTRNAGGVGDGVGDGDTTTDEDNGGSTGSDTEGDIEGDTNNDGDGDSSTEGDGESDKNNESD